jgi:ion channel
VQIPDGHNATFSANISEPRIGSQSIGGNKVIMPVVLAVVGVVLVVFVLWDALETIVLPRRVITRRRLTSWFYRLTWTPWSAIGRRIASKRRREGFLWLFGPLSVLMLLGVWALGLLIGFALLRNAVDGQSIGHSLYVSATTFFTVGVAEAEPTTAVDRILTVIEGGSGFSFLALVISYLPTFYQGFSRREVNITLLDARAGSPPSAVELLRRHYQNGRLIDLEAFFPEWERWAAELLETHLSYPVLGFFRSQHENESWLATLTLVLDASALVAAAFDGLVAHRANLTFAMARHAAVDLSQVYHTAPHAVRDTRLLPLALQQLTELLGDNATLSERKLSELRALYEPYVAALSEFLLMPLPNWTVQENRRDNWQTTAWNEIDGALPDRQRIPRRAQRG